MDGALVILQIADGDNVLPAEVGSPLGISLQGSPTAPFRVIVPTPEQMALYVINNACLFDAAIGTEFGNPCEAPARRNTLLWIDGAGNGENF